MPAGAPEGVTAWRAGPEALVAHLRAARLAGDVKLMSGLRTLEAFRALGAIDRFEIHVMPVLLGSGIPLSAPRGRRR
ncbi:MAG TPA: hypothetical protein VNN07_05575 [Candidatus Tectomicrobia bacterium]|nr:hypothetical protein [Candidatus Tectomicrobia bacterium]